MKRQIISVLVLLALSAVPALACGLAPMCMDNPTYMGCASAAQNTKESCNNSAGPMCSSICSVAAPANQGTCTANCLSTAFSSCQSWYCNDMDGCLTNICYQN